VKRFVLALMFDPSLKKAVLIRKVRPDWMAGRFNVVGGHIEDETALDAACREFREETGVATELADWHPFLTLVRHGGDETCYLECFWAISERIDAVKSVTDELIAVLDIQSLVSRGDIVEDTLWIIMMGLEAARRDNNSYFTVITVDDESPETPWQSL
jgi:8-oxo-dGTP pyrophosphatase MutT (NUDIX family)